MTIDRRITSSRTRRRAIDARRLGDPQEFRGHGFRPLCARHGSLLQVLDPAPPSLHGVPSSTVPPLQRYYETLRLPAVLPTSLRHPSAHGDRGASGDSLHTQHRCALWRPGGRWPAPPLWLLESTETTGPPRFLRNPCVCVPRSSTPVGQARSTACYAPGVAFRNSEFVDPTTTTSFEAQSRSPHTRCLRFAPRVATTGRKTRYRLPQPGLAGRDWVPAGFQHKVSSQVMTILLVQALPGAPECLGNQHGGVRDLTSRLACWRAQRHFDSCTNAATAVGTRSDQSNPRACCIRQ